MPSLDPSAPLRAGPLAPARLPLAVWWRAAAFLAIGLMLALGLLGALVLLAFLPPHLRDEASAVTQEIVTTMGGYTRARSVAALIVGAVTYGGLLLTGVPYPLTLALLAGAGELVPIAGPLVAAGPAAATALLISPAHGLVVVAFYTVVQQLKSHLLVPSLVNRHADIPPLLVIFAVLAGGWVGDIVGALVGPPPAGALRIVLVRIIAPALRCWTKDQSAAASSTPGTQNAAESMCR